MKINQTAIQEANFGIVNEVPVDTLIQNAVVNQHPLYYCAGKIFIFEGFAQTEWQHQQISQGKHWFYSLNYSQETTANFCDSFKDESTGTVIPCVNLDHNNFWRGVFEELNK